MFAYHRCPRCMTVVSRNDNCCGTPLGMMLMIDAAEHGNILEMMAAQQMMGGRGFGGGGMLETIIEAEMIEEMVEDRGYDDGGFFGGDSW